MADFYLTPAVEADFSAIKHLIFETGINPMSLKWERFYIAKSSDDNQFIGCGQLKPHSDGTVELASIATVKEWRSKGVASAMIQKLMEMGPRPLYLTCVSTMGPFYEKFGFRTLEQTELPKYFRRLSNVANFVNALHVMNHKLLVMRLD